MLLRSARVALAGLVIGLSAFAASPKVEILQASLGKCPKLIIVEAKGDRIPNVSQIYDREIPGFQNRRDLLWHVAENIEIAGKIADGLQLAVPEMNLAVRFRRLIWGETLIHIEKPDGSQFTEDELARLPKPPITTTLPFSRELSLPLYSAKDAVELKESTTPKTPPLRAHFLISELSGLVAISHMAVPDDAVRAQVTAEVLNSIREVARVDFFKSLVLGTQMPGREDWVDSLRAQTRQDLAEKFDGTYSMAQACVWWNATTWKNLCKRNPISTSGHFRLWLEESGAPEDLVKEIMVSFGSYKKQEYRAPLSIRIMIYPGHNVAINVDVTFDYRATLGIDGRFFLVGSDFRNVVAFASRLDTLMKEPRAEVSPFLIEPGIEVKDETLRYHALRLDALAQVIQRNYANNYLYRRDEVVVVEEIEDSWTWESPFSGDPAPSDDHLVTPYYHLGVEVSGGGTGYFTPNDPPDVEPDEGPIRLFGTVAQRRYIPRSMDGAVAQLLAQIHRAASRIPGANPALAQQIFDNARSFSTSSGLSSIGVVRVLRSLHHQLTGLGVQVNHILHLDSVNSRRLAVVQELNAHLLNIATAISSGKLANVSKVFNGRLLQQLVQQASYDRHVKDTAAALRKKTEEAQHRARISSSSETAKAQMLRTRMR